MSLARATAFLANTAITTSASDTPESRLMQALERRKTLPFTEIPSVTGLAPDRALILVEQLRDAGKAVVLEQPDGSELFLGLN